MNTIQTGKTVYWKNDWSDPNEAWHVGNLLLVESKYKSGVILLNGGVHSINSLVLQDGRVLVRHARTTTETEHEVLEFVPWNKLFNYYGDRTPPEFEKEHASVPYKSDGELKVIGRLNKHFDNPISDKWYTDNDIPAGKLVAVEEALRGMHQQENEWPQNPGHIPESSPVTLDIGDVMAHGEAIGNAITTGRDGTDYYLIDSSGKVIFRGTSAQCTAELNRRNN